MKKNRLLIVEDDPSCQLSLEMLLEKMGFEYAIFATAEEAFDAARQSVFDLALLDIHLKGAMNGIELAAQLTARLHLPVIFLTAHDDVFTYEKACSTADSIYLVKPVNKLTLRSVIETVLRKKDFVSTTSESELAGNNQEVVADSFLYLKFKNRATRVETSDILYVRAEGNYCYLHTKKQRFIMKTSLRKIAQKLPSSSFQQIHRNYIVQLDRINRVDLATEQLTVEQQSLPVGSHYKSHLLQRLHRI